MKILVFYWKWSSNLIKNYFCNENLSFLMKILFWKFFDPTLNMHMFMHMEYMPLPTMHMHTMHMIIWSDIYYLSASCLLYTNFSNRFASRVRQITNNRPDPDEAVYIVLLAANMLGQHAGPTMLAQQNVGPTLLGVHSSPNMLRIHS